MNSLKRSLATLGTCVTLVACSPPGASAAAGSTPSAASNAAKSEPVSAPPESHYTATSRLPGLHAKALGTLPAPAKPSKFAQDDFCSYIAQKPETAAGKDAAAKGWTVSSEVTEGGFTAVGIFSQGEQGTSGTCMVRDGNIAIYRGTQLLGIVYADTPKEGEMGDVGGVMKTPTPGRLRIGDFTPANYVSGDIVLAENGFEVVPLATSEKYCGLDIPSLYGKEVPKARALLAKTGWKPKAPREEGEVSYPGHLTGEPEIADCSGTGYGFCSGGYAHPSGALMSFTTAGDGPATIVSYDVTCPGKK